MTDHHAHAKPVNRTARSVAAGGYNYEPGQRIGQTGAICSEAPIPTKTPPEGSPLCAGYHFARFTVVGYYGKGGRWVVRCDCGRYSVRTFRAISNPENVTDRCDDCNHKLHLRKIDWWRRHGTHYEGD